MSVEVTLKDEDFIETTIKIESAVDRALADGAAEIQGTAQQLCPVGKTGLLRSSITISKTDDMEYTVSAGDPEVEYAGFVEFGTGVKREAGAPGPPGRKDPWVYFSEEYGFVTTSGNPAQPFMRPAYERHRKSIEAQVKLAAERASR